MSRTRINVAVGLSLLAHGLIMAVPIHQRMQGNRSEVAAARVLDVRIVDSPSPAPNVPLVKPEPSPAPVPRPVPRVVPVRPPVVPTPTPAPVPVERPREPAPDMLAMIDARRERRLAQEAAVREQLQATAPSRATSPDAALAAIQRNLRTLGPGDDPTGGVFTLLEMGTRTAKFSFNGWKAESQRRWRQVIEVDAPSGELELAVVRRMIQVIRESYTEDFTWHSHRLGRSLVLSARVQDSAELEDFLRKEFFGTPTLQQRAGNPRQQR